MSNAFKQIEPNDNLPKRVKKETLSNIYSLKMFMDLMDLFVVKSASTFSKAISGNNFPDEGKAMRDNQISPTKEGS